MLFAGANIRGVVTLGKGGKIAEGNAAAIDVARAMKESGTEIGLPGWNPIFVDKKGDWKQNKTVVIEV